MGHTLGELNLRGRYQTNVVAVRSGEMVNAMPDQSTRIAAEDVMLVVALTEAGKRR